MRTLTHRPQQAEAKTAADGPRSGRGERSPRAPSDGALQWLMDRAAGQRPVQRKRADPGYRVLVELARGGPRGPSGPSPQASGGVIQRLSKHNKNTQSRIDQFHADFKKQTHAANVDAQEASLYSAASGASAILDSGGVPPIGPGVQVTVDPKAVEDYINWVKGQVGPRPGDQESTIRWGPTWNGLGHSMTAILRPGGQPEGSGPSIAWDGVWGDLKHRGGKIRQTTMYIMGHLLNDNIGGPGLAYNLTPLIGKNKGFGATDSNGLHLDKVETDVKRKHDEMMSSTTPSVAELSYNVTAVYGRPNRATEIQKLQDVAREYNAMMVSSRINNPGVDPLHNTVKKELETGRTVGSVNTDIKAVHAALKPGPSSKAVDIHGRMTKNIGLWQKEDAYVPARLDCDWTWVDAKGQKNPSAKIPIEVKLPDQLEAPYKEP